jgi:predicted short-subunit dehydrogenase-like oxidoreductase (DUF2520 family)
VIADLKLPGKVVAHTAASVSKHVLKDVSNHYGVFYPLQSLRKEMPGLPDVPIFFDGSDEITNNTLNSLARSISPDQVKKSDDDDRSKLHVAAVVVSNFPNYLYVLAEEYCKKEKIDFRLLQPLIVETAQRIQAVSPSEVQTGPAIRHDEATINKHLQLLKSHPELKEVYTFLSKAIGDRQ